VAGTRGTGRARPGAGAPAVLKCRPQGRSGNRGDANPSRKVRTPQGGIAANGRPATLAGLPAGKAEEQGHRDESVMRARLARTGTAISVPRRPATGGGMAG